METNCLLLRYGEVGLKSKKTRPYFEKKYVNSIKEALKRSNIDDFKIKNYGGRFVLFVKETKKSLEILNKVPGIQSLSEAKHLMFSNKKNLIYKCKTELEEKVRNKIFAVRVKREGKHDFKSTDIAKELGSELYDKSKGVNLSNPEIELFIEIRNKEAFIFTEIVDGIGGLPAGTSDKVLSLFSGGIDSPVAAFEMIKRGCKTDFLFVDLIGEKNFFEVATIYNEIINNYCFSFNPKIFIVEAKELIKKIKSDVHDSLKQLAFKIVLYKIAEKIAERNNCLCLVTGEALCQKSSQTLSSLLFIEQNVNIPVMRPLLTMDKKDIVLKAQKINTLAGSEKIKEYCDLSNGPVSVNPRFQDLKKIPLFEEEIRACIENVKIIKGPVIIKDERFKTEKIEKSLKKVVIDIRPFLKQKLKPIKNSIKINPEKIELEIKKFDRKNHHIIVCDSGSKSEEFAFQIRKKGFSAEGKSLKKYLNNNNN